MVLQPSAKIYITIFIMQVTNVEITNTIHQLLTFETCGLVNPVAFVVAVRGRALHGQPLPIPHVHQLLLLQLRAICAAWADLFGCVVYLHTWQGWCRNNFQSSHHTAKVLTKFSLNHAVPCEF